jgi:circadian clock protein KaiB
MAAKPKAKKTAPKAKAKNRSLDFEKLLQQAASDQQFVLRLYVTGNTVRSAQAIANVRSLCEEYLAGRYDLEVVDVYQQPQEAAKEQIIAAPTLIKELPYPIKRLIGDLSDRDKVLVGLNLKAADGKTKSDKTRWVKM